MYDAQSDPNSPRGCMVKAMNSSSWSKLNQLDVIRRGWHLARNDSASDFAEILFSAETFGLDLKNQALEIRQQLKTGNYVSRKLFSIDVPKGALGVRPGSVIPMRDRVLLSSAAYLLAKKIDSKIPQNVYSYRVKNNIFRGDSIFYGGDISNLPFLRKVTIEQNISPFTRWSSQWPEYERVTRRLFEAEGYRYLATSDIAAYFENIQLPILRDDLLSHFPEEKKIINLILRLLESWCDETDHGRAHHRGIPQGNFVSSLLANVFLLPLDKYFFELEKKIDIRYFRYMDDTRVFAKTREDARFAVLKMAQILRTRHLNVQTAKTKILDERAKEITYHLIDQRVDRLSEIINKIFEQDDIETFVNSAEARRFLRKANIIASEKKDGRQSVIGAKSVLEGMDFRVLIRWSTVHLLLNSHYPVARLLHEMKKSSDGRVTDKLLKFARKYPNKRKIQSFFYEMHSNGSFVFRFQAAELLRAIRYQSTIDVKILNISWQFLFDPDEERYLRMQAANLLQRKSFSQSEASRLRNLFKSEPDPYIKCAIGSIMVCSLIDNSEVVRMLVLHANEQVRELGKVFRMAKNDLPTATQILSHALAPGRYWAAADNLPFFSLMAVSGQTKIREHFVKAVKASSPHPIVGIRNNLKFLASIANKQ